MGTFGFYKGAVLHWGLRKGPYFGELPIELASPIQVGVTATESLAPDPNSPLTTIVAFVVVFSADEFAVILVMLIAMTMTFCNLRVCNSDRS